MSQRPKMAINVKPEDIPETLKEAVWVMHNLRKRKKEWDEKYGVEAKNAMKLWEKVADEFLEKIIIKE